LFTKVSATIPRSRIQFISIHRSWIARKLGLAAIRIETAGGGGTEHENASQSVGRRWFVPVISESQVVGLIEHLRPGIHWTESQFDWQPLSPRAGTRLQRFGIIAAVVLTAVAGFVWQPWGATVGIVLLPLFLWIAHRQAKAMRYARSGPLVVFRSGMLTRKCSCAFVDKIQTLKLSESPFDRRWNMATLSVDTAAAGPAEHKIEVKYLDANVAQREYANLRAVVA
jgi:putative membrane protein